MLNPPGTWPRIDFTCQLASLLAQNRSSKRSSFHTKPERARHNSKLLARSIDAECPCKVAGEFYRPPANALENVACAPHAARIRGPAGSWLIQADHLTHRSSGAEIPTSDSVSDRFRALKWDRHHHLLSCSSQESVQLSTLETK